MARIPQKTNKLLLLPPMPLTDCIAAVSAASKAYAEATNLPATRTSRSWFVAEFARQIHKVQGPRWMRNLAVETDGDPARIGNFFLTFDEKSGVVFDLVACAPWGNKDPEDGDYGNSEPFLPAFHVIKIFLDTQEQWTLPSEIAREVKGPLTVTLVWINRFGTEVAAREAWWFKMKMERANLHFDLSTEIMTPGIMAVATVSERADPFQVLTVSESFEREPLRNPFFKGGDANQSARGPRRTRSNRQEN